MGEYVNTWRGPVYRRTPEELAAVKAKRASLEMHCQCCTRAILANTGKIAHHGYERPGSGWQTASCMGAKHLPFEVDRTQLGHMIVSLKRHLKNLNYNRTEAVAEKYPLRFEYSTYDPTIRFNSREIKRYVEFDREMFPLVKEAKYFAYYDTRTFDDFKKAEIASIDSKIRITKTMIHGSQKRYDGWKQTHKRVGTRWVPVDEVVS